MTWPLVIIRVNRSTYEDIKRRVIAAGQADRIFNDGRISVDECAIEIDPKNSSLSDIISAFDEITLIGLVMRLTGGSANPKVVESQIRRIKDEGETNQDS